MSRQYDAKQEALKAYPTDKAAAVELFLEYLDISENDFLYEEGMSPSDYIYGSWKYLKAEREEDMDVCGICMGSGYDGHPDCGSMCSTCNGSGGVKSKRLPSPKPIQKKGNENERV